MPKKIYSEAEAGAILQRATELQEKDAATGYTSGVTIEELQRIAREMGIAEDALQAALVQPAEESKTSFLNLVETHERVFEGEIDFNRMDEVIEAIGDGVKITPINHIGRTVRAQVTSGTVFGTLELTSRNGRTKLKFRQTPFIAYFAGLHVPLILSVVAGANFFARGMFVPGLISLIVLLGFGATLFATFANGGKKKARRIVNQMSDRIGELLVENAQPVPAAPVAMVEPEQHLSQGS